jgi:hypothetical protein
MKRYTPFTQQPYLCVAACLQMVLYRRGIPLLEQEDIANELGLIIPEEDLKYFAHARTGEMPSSGWGTQIQNDQYSMQKLFDKQAWPLNFTRYSEIHSVDELREKLLQVQHDNGADAMLCFDYGILWGLKDHGGHVCVFEKIEGDIVHIIDPERNVRKRRQADIHDFFKAIDFHGAQNAAGIWMISDRKEAS